VLYGETIQALVQQIQLSFTYNQQIMRTPISKFLYPTLALLAFTACGSGDAESEHKEHMQNDSTMHSNEEHAAAYQCPMKCEGDKTYTEAGQCPVCKMNLKKVE